MRLIIALVTLTLSTNPATAQGFHVRLNAKEEAFKDLTRFATELTSDGSTPQDIVDISKATRDILDQLFQKGARRERWLGVSAAAGSVIVKLGQYAGGGGAFVFGLQAKGSDNPQNSGRNAAYAGAVATGVTLLEQVFDLPEKKRRQDACKTFDTQRLNMFQETRAWEFNRNDESFRNGFLAGPFKHLNDEMTKLYADCVK